jgi:hypothetical protein
MFKQMVLLVGQHQLMTVIVVGLVSFALFRSLKFANKVFGDEDYVDKWRLSIVMPGACFLIICFLVILLICSLTV